MNTAATYSLYTMPTPAVGLDGERAEQNIRRLADYAAQHGMGVRPHTKTHKSVEIARRQLAAGAVGLTVAKVGEAEALLPATPAQL